MNCKMKNTELIEIPEVKAALEAGKVVLIDKKPTSNPEYTNLYFFGKVEGMGASSEVSAAAAMFLKWTTSYNQRAIQNARTEVADKFEVGHTFDDFALRCMDSLEPSFQGHTPRVNSAGELLQHKGKDIYRHFELVTKDELKAKGHVTIAVVKEEAEAPQGVNADALLKQ